MNAKFNIIKKNIFLIGSNVVNILLVVIIKFFDENKIWLSLNMTVIANIGAFIIILSVNYFEDSKRRKII
jgi:hypothetical protein